jgi:aspartate/methionine/tyrosine aminotransferase
MRSGVLVTPSDAFHVGTGPAPRAVRISLTPPRTRELVQEGIRRLSELLSRPAGPGPAIV